MMKTEQLFLLMGVAYIAPTLTPKIASITGVICLVIAGFISFVG